MQKIIIIIIFVGTLVLINCQVPKSSKEKVLSGKDAVTALIAAFKGAVTKGTQVQLSNGPFVLGLVPLPVNFLCNVTKISRSLACHICTLDCTYVHNKYGGGCGKDPTHSDRGVVCLCNDKRNPNGTIATPAQTCDPVVNRELDPLISAGIKAGALIREFALLCNPPKFSSSGKVKVDSTGCSTDCATNHQYTKGSCKSDYAVPRTAKQTEKSNGKSNFCLCE